MTAALNINKAELFKRVGYVPHSEKQWEVHNSTARFRIASCGRRWGKSTFAANEFTAYLFIPDTYWWICGPTYRLGEKEFRIIYNNVVNKLKLGRDIKKQYNVNQGNMRLEMPWNTVLEVVSAEKQDSLVGEGLDGVIMSEAAKHNRSTWEMYIRPALSDKRGIALFPSTPQGFNWFYGLFQLAELVSEEHYQAWQMPSWTNPIAYPLGRQDPEILELERNTSKQFFDQEIAAEFTSFVGQIYDEFEPDLHIIDYQYNPFWRNYWALDFGFTDPFVCLDVQVDQVDNVYVWREYQVSGLATYQHGKELLSRPNPEGFSVVCGYADPRGPDEIATLQLLPRFPRIWARDVGWSLGVEAVKRWLKVSESGKPKLFIDRSCTNLIRQLKTLRVKDVKEGHNARPGQHDYDDHGPDALRYFFNEMFVMGANASLSSVYDPGYRGSEAESFFTLNSSVTMDTRIGYE